MFFSRSQWIVLGICVVAFLATGLLFWAAGAFDEEVVPAAPTSTETCTLYYLDEAARAEGRAFSLWCPTAGWVDLTDRPLP